MKPNTELWMRCESVGRPKSSMTHYGRLDECIRKSVEWLLSAYMGSKIRINFARTEAELGASKHSVDVTDIMSDLESLIPVDAPEVCMDASCANKEPHELDSADCTSRKQGQR